MAVMWSRLHSTRPASVPLDSQALTAGQKQNCLECEFYVIIKIEAKFNDWQTGLPDEKQKLLFDAQHLLLSETRCPAFKERGSGIQ